MKNKSIIEIPRNQRGVSLIQVMVSVAILSIISIGYMQMTQSGLSSSKQVESSIDVFTTLNEIGNLLGNSQNCSETFKDLNAQHQPAGIEHLLLRNNNNEFIEKYIVGNSMGNSHVKIEKYFLSDEAQDVSVEDENTTYLNIKFNRGKSVKQPYITKRVKLNVTLDTSGKIENCYAAGFGRSGGGVQIVSSLPSTVGDYICSNHGSMRFIKDDNRLQICGSDNIWYNVVITCSAGAVRTCPSDSGVFSTCNALGLWGSWSGDCPE